MTAEEFARSYAERAGVTEEWLKEHGRFPRPCDCGESYCEGWQMDHATYVDPNPESEAMRRGYDKVYRGNT